MFATVTGFFILFAIIVSAVASLTLRKVFHGTAPSHFPYLMLAFVFGYAVWLLSFGINEYYYRVSDPFTFQGNVYQLEIVNMNVAFTLDFLSAELLL